MRALSTALHAPPQELAEAVRARGVRVLTHRLADAVDLGTQAKQARWYLNGPQLFPLHELFEGVYATVMGYVDLLAERVIALGGTAPSATQIAAMRSELPQHLPATEGEAQVAALRLALAVFGLRMREAVDTMEELQDLESLALCVEISRGIDKRLWMVEAHGQESPTVLP